MPMIAGAVLIPFGLVSANKELEQLLKSRLKRNY
jgi:hypothetical protein